jgi:endonuclease/exonuclease/phosphatase (EEP) superfamily protein YafD
LLYRILNHPISKTTITSIFVFGLSVVIVPEWFDFSQKYNHFAIQIMFAYLFLGLLFLMLRQKTLMSISFLCCALLCFYLKLAVDVEGNGFNILRQQRVKEAVPTRFSVAHFNLGAGNDEAEILASIRNADADLVSIQEIRPDLLSKMTDSLDVDYHFHETLGDIRMLGMGVFSKKSLTTFGTINHKGLVSTCGNLSVGNKGESIHFVTTNTMPALNEQSFAKLREHLKTLILHLDTLDAPVIALGDFNAAPWSNIIIEFETRTHLKDSREGFMSSFTGGSTSMFGAPLNHIFYSKHLKCMGFETIPSSNFAFSGIKGIYELKLVQSNASATYQ